jgi:TolB-like protein/DNA-binding winged helix-turn-helix (wHTH) protein/Tfp pilus assembly protein PilF
MQRIAHDTRSFDGFTLDLTRGCLLRGAQEIKLKPKPFEVLVYLIDNPGRLIKKAELIQVLWPDTAVTDDSLVQCIGDVRRALGDDTQKIIRTVTRRGYIFDRPVTRGPTGLTTYTEEKGVQIIIEEEETNGHAMVATPVFPTRRTAVPNPTNEDARLQRLTTAIRQHKLVAAFSVLTMAIAAAVFIYSTRPGEAIDSVAVMPFVNVSGDPNTEYISDGISESIINSLSPSLKVIALNSVLRYKGKQTDPQAVGRELNVQAVLVGRLTQRGDDLAISVELVDVRNNRHLWGQQYNRKLAEISAVPTEIAQDISEKLRLQLTGDETKRLAKHYTQNAEAYQLYMLGRYYFNRSGKKEDVEKSIEYYEQAIKKDPTYAPAYAGLGTTYHLLGWMGWLPPKESWQKEEWAALKAQQIDDTLAEAHVLKAAIKEFNLDWTGAEKEYKRALELDPNSVRAHETYGWHLEMFGRFDDAMSHLKRAQELDPLSLELMWNMGVWLSFSRQYDRAIEQLQKIIEMDSNFIPAHTSMAETYQKKGMYEEAIAELKIANVSGPPLGYAYAVAGKRDEAQKMLDDLKELSKQRYVSPKGFAMIYMGLGDKDQAFEWFNKTFDENPYRIAFIKVDPRFDSLRSDPRFTDLLRRMKLVS